MGARKKQGLDDFLQISSSNVEDRYEEELFEMKLNEEEKIPNSIVNEDESKEINSQRKYHKKGIWEQAVARETSKKMQYIARKIDSTIESEFWSLSFKEALDQIKDEQIGINDLMEFYALPIVKSKILDMQLQLNEINKNASVATELNKGVQIKDIKSLQTIGKDNEDDGKVYIWAMLPEVAEIAKTKVVEHECFSCKTKIYCDMSIYRKEGD